MADKPFTVGDLKRELAGCADDEELQFPGGLTFYRIKRRGEQLQVLEFNEAEAAMADEFRKQFPSVKVMFLT